MRCPTACIRAGVPEGEGVINLAVQTNHAGKNRQTGTSGDQGIKRLSCTPGEWPDQTRRHGKPVVVVGRVANCLAGCTATLSMSKLASAAW